MGRISFTANLQRHVPCPSATVSAATPRLRSYLLDEHGRLRRHVNIYVNDAPLGDRTGLG